MIQAWNTWAALWDHREHPRSLALIRILLGIVVCWDLFWIGWMDLVIPLMASPEAGGFSSAMSRQHPPLWFQWTPPTAESAWWLYLLLCGSAIGWTTGTLTPVSMLVFVLASAQFESILPNASRAIDTLIRNLLMILVFSKSHRICDVCFSDWLSFTGELTVRCPQLHLLVLHGILNVVLVAVIRCG